MCLKFCPYWKASLLVIGHVGTIRLLRELVGLIMQKHCGSYSKLSVSFFPFGLFSPSPPLSSLFLCLPCKLIFQTFFLQLHKFCLELRWSSLHLQMKWWQKNAERWVEAVTAMRRIINLEIQQWNTDRYMTSSSICKTTGFRIQTRDVHWKKKFNSLKSLFLFLRMRF